ncbi:MAG: hypothetical protein QOG20_1596 [Pseudonocardiales bacterium]|uniref:hypothetical protein n=1 Tax=Pseudonocardia sp. TaxID=60912 RepID=UPI00260BDE98|nr:hypothetical protein [Pseudonocardia sp.]MCW2720661.1 hypothetical protein [Pseudonocardia sp.]MDT7617217.1 hypothetical protein [Pseudonocardiales bacterium]MDT7705989.1 hypothetical protein [Pseudonocardiales bacterium]
MTAAVRDVAVRDYDSGVFQRLNDFSVARGYLGHSRDYVTELGDLICHHGLHEVLGVTLLHKHFEITGDEMVVREFVDGVSYMRPWDVEALPLVLPYLWKAEVDGGHADYFPLEFCAYPAGIQDEVERDLDRLRDSVGFLAAFAEALDALGLREVFGLAHLRSRDGLTLGAGETLLETTDEVNRILTLRPARAQEVEGLDTTQTLWIYRPAPSRVGAVLNRGSGGVHCAAHCQAHCTGHH